MSGVRLNVGCGKDIFTGWTNLDRLPGDGVDIVFDLDKCLYDQIPIKTGSVEFIMMSHVLEHLQNPLPVMQDLHRVAKPDAVCEIRVPHGASNDAWEDPTHVRPYFESSFIYFSQPTFHRADYGYRGDWQTERVLLLARGDTSAGENGFPSAMRENRNIIAEMRAYLRCVKPIREQKKELMEPAKIEYQLV